MTSRTESGAGGIGFSAYVATSFLGAFNDNVSKILVICYATAALGKTSQGASNFLAIASACFILPYLCFSTIAGYLADRFSKRAVMIWSKAAEIAIMLIGLVLAGAGAVYGLLAVLFFMGTQSAFFSPAKYGFLPETQPVERLSRANGCIQLATFVAIIIGGAIGGVLSARSGASIQSGFIFCVIIAVLGTLTSLAITRTIPGQRDLKFRFQDPIRPHIATIREIARDRVFFHALFGKTFFWFLGTLLQLALILLAQNTLHGDDRLVGLLQAAAALGIGAGFAAAGILSRGKIALRFVRPAAFGIIAAGSCLALFGDCMIPAFVFTTLMGFCGGFYALPLDATIQNRAPANRRGQYLAAANALDCISMIAAPVLLWFLRLPGIGFGARGVIAVLTATVVAAVSRLKFPSEDE